MMAGTPPPISLDELLERCWTEHHMRRRLGKRRARTVVIELARLRRSQRERVMSEALGRLAREWDKEKGLKLGFTEEREDE